jgi:hypothetical protein
MTINATAPILLSFYVALAEEQGALAKDLRGTVQNDVLKEYIARGNYIYPPKGALRLITNMFDWCSKNTPKWNPISISGYHIREAGSNAVQELAFTFSDAIAYVDAAVKAVECLDSCVGRIVEALDKVGGEALLTADHGNVEQMEDVMTGQAHTAHTCEPVPFIYIGKRNVSIRAGGVLAALPLIILEYT